MRTLRTFIRSLRDLPRGASADGRSIGLGLDAAMRAHRARGAEAEPLRRSRPPAGGRPFTRA
ncbi:MAG TPA: hypothetical protein VKZ81_01050 [Pseudonocardia sp.]|jgi:hypothetical protein|uniref:hypothetical protein n=1 Tax=Pseudonocardia sp. TaxID=60912 RepID=UPI002B4AD8FE|nr:hypothetical protein [Pseudonocardia sp.]HLU54021.1 hypothetical protein [Pseudonocardia sp.]